MGNERHEQQANIQGRVVDGHHSTASGGRGDLSLVKGYDSRLHTDVKVVEVKALEGTAGEDLVCVAGGNDDRSAGDCPNTHEFDREAAAKPVGHKVADSNTCS